MFSYLKEKENFEKQIATRFVQFVQKNKRPPSIFSNEPEERTLATEWLNKVTERRDYV